VKPVVAVVGLRREGAVLSGPGLTIVAGGGNPERLAADLAKAVDGAAGIVSFGMAGALDPSLRLGDWVIGERVAGTCDAPCDQWWCAALAQRLPQGRIGAVYADGRLVADPAEKARLAERHGALTVDMESHIAAAAARHAGLPFAILRCVSDEADAELPPAVAVAMRSGGGLALGAVLGSILRQPGQLAELMRTGAKFRRAYASLREGASLAGLRLAFNLR
jgi:hopanoid-associated phosphorylase